jgi:hypothetical protein
LVTLLDHVRNFGDLLMMRSVLKENFGTNRDEVILKTVQDVLLNVFGEKSFKKMLRVMKENYALEWQDIPEKSQLFASALRDILGHGSTIIEDLIVENLYVSFGKELMWKKELSFSDYITQLCSCFQAVC